MKTALVTDGKYRSSIAAVRALHRAGYRVVVTQTRADVKSAPAVSVSKSCDDFRWIDGACADADYAEKLLSVLKEYEHPVLFCVGAVTLNTVAARREEFAALANFLIAPKETLDALNDKESVHQRALELGIPVPREYDGTPESYPVVVKPHCGEKFGLKAADRYAVANNEAEFDAIMEKMQRYDPSPIVQQKITGAGAGVGAGQRGQLCIRGNVVHPALHLGQGQTQCCARRGNVLEGGRCGQTAGGFQFLDQLDGVEGIQKIDVAGLAVQNSNGQVRAIFHINAAGLLVGVAAVLQCEFIHWCILLIS